MKTKSCAYCKITKNETLFNKCKTGKLGLHNHCRECQKIIKHNWYLKNRQKELDKNKTKEIKEKARQYRQKKYWSDPDYRLKTLEKNKLRRREEPAKTKQRENEKLRRKINPTYRIRNNLNTRLKKILKQISSYKTSSIIELCGCDMIQLISHIESLWSNNMSWNNYGPNENNWQIDHIIPCCSFDLTQESEIKKCYHYTNLQPLWKKDNLSKGAKLPDGTDARKYNQTKNIIYF